MKTPPFPLPAPFARSNTNRANRALGGLGVASTLLIFSASASPIGSAPAPAIDPASLPGTPTPAIQAGDPAGSPTDSPANRVDPNVATSDFASVGSFLIRAGALRVGGSGIAINPKQILTAAHLFDLNSDGISDVLPSDVTFNLNDTGDLSSVVKAQSIQLHPDWTGFFNPAMNDDLALVTLLSPLPSSVPYIPVLNNPDPTALPLIQGLLLVGYGQSGDGVAGYSVPFSTSVKRLGLNLLETVLLDDEGSDNVEMFFYDFEDSSDVAKTDVFGIPFSFGNDLETIVGPGDSGGPMFIIDPDTGDLVIGGINTATLGSGNGRFGDIGGGIWLGGYLPWIAQTSAATIPDSLPNAPAVAALALALSGWKRWSRRGRP